MSNIDPYKPIIAVITGYAKSVAKLTEEFLTEYWKLYVDWCEASNIVLEPNGSPTKEHRGAVLKFFLSMFPDRKASWEEKNKGNANRRGDSIYKACEYCHSRAKNLAHPRAKTAKVGKDTKTENNVVQPTIAQATEALMSTPLVVALVEAMARITAVHGPDIVYRATNDSFAHQSVPKFMVDEFQAHYSKFIDRLAAEAAAKTKVA